MNIHATTRHKKFKPALPLTELLVTFTIAQGVIADGFLFACAWVILLLLLIKALNGNLKIQKQHSGTNYY